MEKERKPFMLTSANIAKAGISEINARWEGNSYIVESPFRRAEYIYEDSAHTILLKVIEDDRVAWCYHGSNISTTVRGEHLETKCSVCKATAWHFDCYRAQLGFAIIPYVSLRKRRR
jgi:hypothetical protein